MPIFDHIVLTAANASQAKGYEKQLDARREWGLLTAATRADVVADPGGRRVGSLGATLNVLYELAAEFLRKAPETRSIRDCFANRNVLICHSGGDSRRIPAYAAQGKIFMPLPTSNRVGRPAALFDLVLSGAEALPERAGGQVLVLSGDVLIAFDSERLDLRPHGVIGAAYYVGLARGSRHGVYVARAAPARAGCFPVADFLQKPDEAAAREFGALDAAGRVLVDTGILSFDPAAVETMLTAAGVELAGKTLRLGRGLLSAIIEGASPAADIYEQFTVALAPRADRARYVRGLKGDAGHKLRMLRFRAKVRRLPFHVNVLPDCEFFHVGSSRELLAGVGTLNRTACLHGFQNRAHSHVNSGAAIEETFVLNSRIARPDARMQGSFVEAVNAAGPIALEGRNILVGLSGKSRQAVALGRDLGLVCLPIGARNWTAVLFGMDDDFKTARGDGRVCRFLNRPVEEWLAHAGLTPADVWKPGAIADLWEARMWTVASEKNALKAALAMQAPTPRLAGKWKKTRKFSMRELMGMVSPARLLEGRETIQRQVRIETIAERIACENALPAADALADIRTRLEAVAAWARIADAVRTAPGPLVRARLFRAASMLAKRFRPDAAALAGLGMPNRKALDDAPFLQVARAVDVPASASRGPARAAIQPDQVVWVTTPVRMDFAGGWSDTPPIDLELGGAVLNAAITLNGQYPVQVMAKLNRHRAIRLSSIDLGRTVLIRSMPQLLDHGDPFDWATLPKAALALGGIGSDNPRASLARWLDRFGGGLDLTIFSALPKGSGLGTSSILGAAILACVRRVLGQAASQDEIVALTSVLEQRMNTGGGWQDQVGGAFPGVKLITTEPGLEQRIRTTWVAFGSDRDSQWERRMLLYYTGCKRMARDILRNVVGRYLARDRETLAVISELKDAAFQMKHDLDSRDLSGFVSGLNRYWSLKKRIDPGSTNRLIEAILNGIKPWTDAALLPGAGGGGFIFMVAKDEHCAQRIREHLLRNPPNSDARFFDFQVDPLGLRTTVL